MDANVIFNPGEVRKQLKRLRELDRSFRIFGSAEHRYELRPKLGRRCIKAIETKYDIELPNDYRDFLSEVGNGGAGPEYGLLPITEIEKYKLGSLQTAFPYHDAWNVPDDYFVNLPNPWGSNSQEERVGWSSMEEFVAHIELQPYDQEAGEKSRKAEAWYFGSEHINGTIPLCHIGCGDYNILVVRGPERGHVWLDARESESGILPLKDDSGKRVTFGAWYCDWLQQSLQELGV